MLHCVKIVHMLAHTLLGIPAQMARSSAWAGSPFMTRCLTMPHNYPTTIKTPQSSTSFTSLPTTSPHKTELHAWISSCQRIWAVGGKCCASTYMCTHPQRYRSHTAQAKTYQHCPRRPRSELRQLCALNAWRHGAQEPGFVHCCRWPHFA